MFHHKDMQRVWGIVIAALIVGWATMSPAETGPAAVREAIEADWDKQEARKGRAAGDPAAILEAAERGERLLADLQTLENAPHLDSESKVLSRLRGQLANLQSSSEAQRLPLYREIRWLNRDIALKNPLMGDAPSFS